MSDQSIEAIYQFLRLSDRIGTAGQPTAEQFTAIKDAGYQVVINLLPSTREMLPNEQELVGSLGMEYVSIPVVWEAPTREDLERFFAAMEAHGQEKVFVHCAANKRVSAFLYLYRVLREQTPGEAAQADLNRIWVPNPIWQRFIAANLASE